jgi:hypothetical protein
VKANTGSEVVQKYMGAVQGTRIIQWYSCAGVVQGYRDIRIEQENHGKKSSTVIQGYRSSTVLVQGYRRTTVVLGLCRGSRVVQEYTGKN